MLDKLSKFEHSQPEIVFHWKDRLTEAEGWTVINSLRGGAAGGGTRMRKGLTQNEVLSLAKTMEIKFSVCGPPIGGAKSGINFDPMDPRKEGVLKRWYAAVFPLLSNYYGTGGDLNVDEIKEVLPITRDLGLLHCQEGVVNGHFSKDPQSKKERIRRLQKGVSLPLTDARYTPDTSGKYTLADMITGYGVAIAALHFYDLQGVNPEGKRVVVQGFGNVGGAAAFFMAKRGLKVVAITDKSGGLIKEEGFSLEEITELVLTRENNEMIHPEKLSYEEADARIWDLPTEIFLPCARSRMITKDQVDRMMKTGIEIISPGANVPFKDEEIFLGPTGIYADNHIPIIPDFVANCGMARAFAYFMGTNNPLEDHEICEDSSAIIRSALKNILDQNDGSTFGLWQKGLEIELNKLEN